MKGQADYFATAKCFRLYAESLGESAFFDSEGANRCRRAFSSPNQSALCERSIEAAIAFAKTLAYTYERATGITVSVESAHQGPAVSKTIHGHSPIPCRLETLIRGALCEESALVPFSDCRP